MNAVSYLINEENASIAAICNQQRFDLAPLWLRERCQDGVNLDQKTNQRLFNPHALDENIRVVKLTQLAQNRVNIQFDDGYSGDYDLTKFDADFDLSDGIPAAKPWTNAIDKSQFYVDYPSLHTEAGMKHALETFFYLGAIIVKNVPRVSGAIFDVGNLFGHIRETNFGKLFEVVSKPDSTDLAYRSVSLSPHTDNPYRDPIPGIQLLHCLENKTSQGLSTLVDSLRVLEQLKVEQPEGFALLCRVPIRYRYVDSDVDVVERRPMIETDQFGNLIGLAYSPRLDFSPLLPEAELKIFHRARKRLGELLSAPEYEWCFRLEPGELQMFHNSRVLHGRTSFDPNEGLRHLQGAYIDLDGPKSRYRAIMNKQRKEV